MNTSDVNAFLSAIKADLIERRLWVVLVALAIALVAAVLLIGGGPSATSSPATTAQAPVAGGPDTVGPQLVPAPLDPNAALAETDNGAALQRSGGAHDPFTALVLPGTHSPAPSKGVGSGGAGGGPGAPGGSSGGPGNQVPTPSTPTPPSSPPPSNGGGGKKGTKPSAPVRLSVDLRLGVVPALIGPEGGPTGPSGATGATGPQTPGQPAPPPFPTNALTDHSNPMSGTILPSSKDALLRVQSVSSDGSTVTFQLATQLFLNGEGTCVPSPLDCTSLSMKAGEYELLQYQSPSNGQLVAYELYVNSVQATPGSASGASLPGDHSHALGSLAASASTVIGGRGAIGPIETWGVIAGGAPWARPRR